MKKRAIVFTIFLSSLIILTYFISADFTDDGTSVQNVTECGILNTSYATYTLNQSMGSGADGDCLLIANDSIILDCAGFNITYGNATGGAGIYVFNESGENGFNNITIQNCILIQNITGDGDAGIQIGANSTNITLYNNTITTLGSDSNGIHFEANATNTNITSNNINISGTEVHGISFESNSVNANITSNNITTSGIESHGIFLADGSNNVNATLNIITTSGVNSSGIKIGDSSINASVNFNDITTSGSGLETCGIYLAESGTNANITSNTVNTSGEDASGIKMGDELSGLVYNNTITTSGNWSLSNAMGGIWLESDTAGINVSTNTITISGYHTAGIWAWTCDNHSIENNIITATGEADGGIVLLDTQGTNITSNTINITGDYGDGIYSFNSENSLLFYNNVITTSGTEAYGFNLNQTSNSNFSSNNITTSGTSAYGMFFNQSHNNTLANNRITTGSSTAYLLYFTTSGNQSIYDNIFNTSTTGSGIFINSSNLNYFNTSGAPFTNIIGKGYYGGNFWTNANSNGYSDYCTNINDNYYCDSPYRVVSGVDSYDYLPLTNYHTNISVCAALSVKKRYTLNQSLSSNGTCFNITTNGVQLDLAEHIITGNTTGYGVNITAHNDTTILNGSISNFSVGIYATSTTNTNITLTTISSTESNSSAITLSDADNSTINSNTITTSGNLSEGIYATSSSYCNLTNNNITTTGIGTTNSGNGSPINILNSSNYFLIYNNRINTTNANVEGIYLSNDSYGNLSSNTINTYGNKSHGLYLTTTSNNNSIISNIINTHYTGDINLYSFYAGGSSTGNNISSNNISSLANQSFGIYLSGQTNNTFVYGNRITCQGYLAISLTILDTTNATTGLIIRNNNILANHSSLGIAIATAGSVNALFYNNILNSTHGSYLGTSFNNFYSEDNLTNQWNTSKTASTNIIGRSYIGGNYWTTPNGTGYSDYCTNTDSDYICDTAYTITANNIDRYPLTNHLNTTTTTDTTDTTSGGGSDAVATYYPTKEQLAEGYTLTIPESTKVKFYIGNKSHELVINSIDNTTIKITVTSEPQIKTLRINDEAKFELTDDNFYDFSVKLESITNSQAKLLMKTISESIPANELTNTQESNNETQTNGTSKNNAPISYWITVSIILIITVAVTGYYYFKKRK